MSQEVMKHEQTIMHTEYHTMIGKILFLFKSFIGEFDVVLLDYSLIYTALRFLTRAWDAHAFS